MFRFASLSSQRKINQSLWHRNQPYFKPSQQLHSAPHHATLPFSHLVPCNPFNSFNQHAPAWERKLQSKIYVLTVVENIKLLQNAISELFLCCSSQKSGSHGNGVVHVGQDRPCNIYIFWKVCPKTCCFGFLVSKTYVWMFTFARVSRPECQNLKVGDF